MLPSTGSSEIILLFFGWKKFPRFIPFSYRRFEENLYEPRLTGYKIIANVVKTHKNVGKNQATFKSGSVLATEKFIKRVLKERNHPYQR